MISLGVKYTVEESNGGDVRKTLLGAPPSLYGNWERRYDFITKYHNIVY